MPPKRRRTRQTKISFSPAKLVAPRKTDDVDDDDDNDDEIPVRASKRQRLDSGAERGMQMGMPVSTNKQGMFGGSDAELLSSESDNSDDNGSVAEVTPVKKVSRSKKKVVEQEVSDEESEAEEQEELAKDLAFLTSSPPPDKGRLRSNHTKPQNKRQQALEVLKQRRAAQVEPPSSGRSVRRRPVAIESDSDSELEVIHEDDDDEDAGENSGEDDEDQESNDESGGEDEIEEPFDGQDVFQENAEDEDFIVDDDNDALLGAPAHSSLPIQFSSLSSAKPRDLFKYVVEWMVHKKINPAFPSQDEIYDLAFRKLDDEVNGLANSKYSSAAWTVDFTRAVRARPEIIINEISKFAGEIASPHCEACNRKSHNASFEIQLKGPPYHKESLERVSDDSESDSHDSDSESSLSSVASETALNGEKPARNADGERIAPESKKFFLGSTCKANAQMAHTLHHWRYHLNQWVVDYLVSKGHLAPDQLAKRVHWSDKKRQKLANKIIDEMESNGQVKQLHRLYKQQVDYASEADNAHNRGWGRRR